MNYEEEIKKLSERFDILARLTFNRIGGRRAEKQVEMQLKTWGYKVKKIRTGGDFIAEKDGMKLIIEVKSTPTAPLRPLQKIQMKKLGEKKYKVIIPTA